MNARHRMIDGMLRSWLAQLEDEELLRGWNAAISERLQQLNALREFTSQQIERMFRECKPGDTLYPDKRVRFGESPGVLVAACYFVKWQPRKKLLWVSRHPSLRPRDVPAREAMRWLTLDQCYFHQLARTELHVRRRSAKLHHKREPEPSRPPDDIPF